MKTRAGAFPELISAFLRGKIAAVAVEHGEDSPDHRALVLQYQYDDSELVRIPGEVDVHYPASLSPEFEGRPIVGLERIYRRTVLIEPTPACAAHCRWCARGQVELEPMGKDDLVRAARYIGSPGLRDDVEEVLFTGGDPLTDSERVSFMIGCLRENAPNVRVVRIGTRLPFQAPELLTDSVYKRFEGLRGIGLELGVHINHPVELWPESLAAVERFRSIGFTVYNQHPLLRGVNDRFEVLDELYSELRRRGIEAHYLFHAAPIRGMARHRTSLKRGIELASRLNSSGRLSGRVKPKFAVLTSVGKVVPFEGTILERNDSAGQVLLQTEVRLAERRGWNPTWQSPPKAIIGSDGRLKVWYRDGSDD